MALPAHPLDPATVQLLEEVELGSARGGRRIAAPLEIEVVRALTEADLPELLSPATVPAGATGHLQIRHSHHLLARCLAEGHSQEHASLMTGYSPSYISSLKGDPAFAELLAYYATQKEQIFLDVAERMRVLGLSTLDELQARLAGKPDEWTRRELMELAELMLVKGRQSPGGTGGPGPGAGAGVTVNVKFVTAGEPKVIDGEATEVPDG